jgi:hypothetical protein
MDSWLRFTRCTYRIAKKKSDRSPRDTLPCNPQSRVVLTRLKYIEKEFGVLELCTG